MGSTLCTPCEHPYSQFAFNTHRTFSSIAQMEAQFKKYAEDNLIGLYGRRTQAAIEKLYTLEQFHICDLLIKLSCEKRMTERDEMLTDIEGINLEQLDHLSLVENIPLNVTNHIENISSIYLDQRKEKIPQLRSINQKNLKNKEYAKETLEKLLQFQKLFILATVECFGSHNILTPLKFPTKKSALQLFMQKVQTVSSKYHCGLMVVFMVNPNFQKKFDEELDRCLKCRDLESSRDTETSLYDFKFQKIIYKPSYPCVDLNGKIIVDNNHIKFQYSSGDFVEFVMKQPRMETLLQKYEYIQIANLNNVIEEIAEKESLVYLNSHPEISIIAHVTPEDPNSTNRECIILKRSFIQTHLKNFKTKKEDYTLNETYYLKSSLFIQSESNRLFHKLISTRIKSQPIDHTALHFVKKISNILYAPLTLLIIKELVEVKPGSPKSSEFVYSNYCKRKIGLRQTADEEIVEVCPQVLFGSHEELKKIIEKLKHLPKVGFPLVINKQKIQQFSK